MLKDIDPGREYLTTSQAAERAELSRVYIAQLLRNGVLEGFQFGRDWFVYVDSLEKYSRQKHKPGPKGPRTKKLDEVKH